MNQDKFDKYLLIYFIYISAVAGADPGFLEGGGGVRVL